MKEIIHTFLFDFSFRHAALRSITGQKQGNFKVTLQEPDKDQQLSLLSKSIQGSRAVIGGNINNTCELIF